MRYEKLSDLAELITRDRTMSTSSYIEDAMVFFDIQTRIIISSGISTKGFFENSHFSALINAMITSLNYSRNIIRADTFFCRFPSTADVGLLIKLKVRSVIYIEDSDMMHQSIPMLENNSIDVMRYDVDSGELKKPVYIPVEEGSKKMKFFGSEEPEIVEVKSKKKFF